MGLEIITYMRKRMDELSQQTGLNFTLLATPAEGLSGRFVRIDQKKFGKIEGVTDREYYTNSFHVPVYYPISAFEKIKRKPLPRADQCRPYQLCGVGRGYLQECGCL